MGLIAGNVGVKAILEVFRCLTFYCSGHGSGYIMGLIAGNVGIKAFIVIFNLLPADFFGRGAGGFHFVGAIHALGECDFVSCAAIGFTYNPFFCILTDGGGLAVVHCFVFHGEGAVIIADHSSGDVIAAWYCVITQVLGDSLRPYGGTSCGIYFPFIGSDGDRAAVFIENGFCSVFHSANGIIDFGGHIARINLGIVVWFASQGNTFCFEAIGDFQILGGDGSVSFDISFGCDGAVACIQISTFQCQAVSFHGTRACVKTVTGNLAFCMNGTTGFDVTTVNFTILGIQAGAGNGAAADVSALGIQAGAGNGGAGNGGAANGFTRNISCRNDIMDIQISGLEGSYTVCQFISGDCTPSINVLDAKALHTGKSAVGSDVHRADFAGCCCDFAVCANRKLSLSSFDGTVSIESRFSISRRIAAGKYAIRCNNGTVRAHFDALFVHGDLIITIYLQYQLIHRRGCGAVVSGHFGNHAVVAHFEIILGIGFPRIDFVNYFSITITGGFEGIVCFFGMVCFSGMGYIIDSNFIRCFPIIFCHYNHIFGLDGARDIRNNIRRFTQYAASCE